MRRSLAVLFAVSAAGVWSCDEAAAPDVVAVELRLPHDSLFYGRSVRISAVALGDSATVAHPRFAWTTSDTAVAIVDSTGTVTGVGLGTATIGAELNGVRETFAIRVVMQWVRANAEFGKGSASQDLADHFCAISTTGRVYCRNPATALDTSPAFVAKPGGDGIVFTSVFSAFENECGLANTGVIYCWGSNSDWLLGTSTPSRADSAPLPVKTDLRFSTMFSGGHTFICAVSIGDDLVRCWGHPHGAVLGRTITQATWGRGADSLIIPVTDSVRGRVVAGSNDGACTLDLTGAVYCWGFSADRLGAPEPESSLEARPGLVAGTTGRGFTTLTATQHTACALDATGTAYCWGFGKPPAAPLPGNLRFRALYPVGSAQGCGITFADDLYCWGTTPPWTVNSRYNASYPQPYAVARGIKFRDLITGNPRPSTAPPFPDGVCGVALDGRIACW